MFNYDFIEAQISKRLLVFFVRKAAEENLNPANMQVIICSQDNTVAAKIYESGNFIRKLELKSIAESFGKEFDNSKVDDVHDYLVKTAKADEITLPNLKVVICLNKGMIGAFAYDKSKFLHQIKSMDLLHIFYLSK